MSVHYKFKSALEYDTVTFDGLHISVKDLKNAIIQQKRIGKSTDFDLQVTNAQTKEVYDDENTLIPKNTSLLIARIPVTVQKQKQWEGYGGDNTPPAKVDEGGPIAKAVDLSSLDAPEDDKIKAMMSQSTQEYDPSNYIKIRGANQMGAVPPNYKCYKCHQGGHWIKDCTFGQGTDPVEIKKSTGIPKSFMVPVDGPQVPGAMMTPNGMYAVPLLDHQAYNHKVTPAPAQEPKPEIPEDLICNICSDLLTDAVMIPCCGNSFCDECIRGVLLESEEHECPDCHDKDISPDTLIPNRFIRTSVAKFKNTTGYVKKTVYREPKYLEKSKVPEKSHTPPPESSAKKSDAERKTVISEADSTEHSKSDSNVDFSKDIDISETSKNPEEGSTPEGPPGVSPRDSPKDQCIRRISTSRDSKERSSHHSKRRDDSPKRSSNHRSSPNYDSRHEERSGTPTIDEPTASGNFGSSPNYNSAPPGSVTSMIGHIHTLQGPPQTIPNTYPIPGQPIGTFPPTQGPPPPNFRLPPPGAAPPPYLAAGSYPIPPRPMFEGSRPPIGGLPPNFNPNFPPGSRSHRDFNRRIRDRTPPGLIDDPLAAFNRMLREKDEQKRRAKRLRRSYSRSRSRSRSFSRSPIRRRSRSPRPLNRRSRSRSRSFSLSRSRSRSFSGSRRGSPYRAPSPRRLSPPPSRRVPSRYRSSPPPLPSSQRSPPLRSRQQNDRHRDRDYDDDRDYNRGDSRRNRNVRDRQSRDRDRYYDKYEDRSTAPPSRSQQSAWQSRNIADNYYPPNVPQGYATNRFPQGLNRDYVGAPYNQPFPQTIHSIQPPQQRQYQDIRPPGVDDDLAPPGVDEPPPKPMESKESPKKEERDKYDKRTTEKRERDKSSDRKRRYEKRSRTPDKARNPSPKRKSKDRDSPDRHRRRRRDSSDDRDKKLDHSDEEKSRKSKDKKKHKDKKDSEKKRKRDRKDKHKKDVKDKKVKEEFKQVIPKKCNEEDTDDNDDGQVIKKDLPEKRRDDKRSDIKERISDKIVFSNKDEIKVLVEEKTNEDTFKQEDPESPLKLEIKSDLYGDISEDIDTNVIETYGKLNDSEPQLENDELADDAIEEGEIKEYDEEEKDVLELHTNDIDLKAELDKSDILAPVPEISKWEVEDDMQTSPKDSHKSDSKSDKSGKVTNEVLKRAENAIFAKAINAIRPIEIKKISLDRAKLYSGEREDDIKIQPTVASTAVEVKKEVQQPQRLSVKDRLGVKVDDPDKVINLTGRHRSRTMSPFSRRSESGRNYGVGERRVEVDDLKSRDRNSRSRSYRRDHSRDHRKLDIRHQSSRGESRRTERKRELKRDEKKQEDTRKSKRKLSRSRSNSDERRDKHKRKDKKQKRDKSKKSKDEDSDEKTEKNEKESKPAATTKRKPTIDEANFEPDYDLESHTEEEEDKDKKIKKHSEENEDLKKSSSSESETDSSSEEERKKKKHKKHKKRRRRETSSSSSSESESDSSDSDRERRKKKHKKNKKKKKKSKHKS